MYILLNSLADTKSLAKKVAESLKGTEVIALNGELGSGKTTFAKMLLESFGFNDVTSPSYCLQNIYQTKKFIIEHWDLYRLRELPEELENISNSVKIIEWADKFDFSQDLELKFELIDENSRKVEIKIYNAFENLQLNILNIS